MSRPRVARRLAFSFLTTAVVLAGAELLWRAAVPGAQAHRARIETVQRNLRYLSPCAQTFRSDGVERLRGLNPANTGGGFDVPLARRPRTARIAVVGESTGTMLGGAMFDLLQTTPREEPVEILNCADSGSALEHAQRRVAEVLDYAPDMLVVVFGHNLMITHLPTQRSRLQVGAVLLRSRLVSDLAGMVSGLFAWPAVEPATRLPTFVSWARRVAAEARARGVSPVFMTVGSNHWFPPAAQWEVVRSPAFLEARLAYASGEVDTAIGLLRSLVNQHREAYWHFQLGVWLARRGEYEDAHEHLRAAVDGANVDPDRATSAVGAAVRALAGEQGVLVHDSARRLAAASRKGLPGWDLMSDHCHAKPPQLVIDAAALIDLALAQVGLDPLQGPAAVAGHERTNCLENGLVGIAQFIDGPEGWRNHRYLEAAVHLVEHTAEVSPEHVIATVDAFMTGPGLDAVRTETARGDLLAAIADGYWAAGLRAPALELNELARGYRSASAWVQQGLFHLASARHGDAAESFRRAVEIEPQRSDAAFFLSRMATEESTS